MNRFTDIFSRKKSLKPTKVFCIGYNKTGTTSMAAILAELGYALPNQAEQERSTVENIYKGNYKPVIKLCQKFDAFQDMPFSQDNTYVAIDSIFPKSKFILTVRNEEEWYASLTRFHLAGILKAAGIDKIEDFREETFKGHKYYIGKNYLYNLFRNNIAQVNDANKVEYNWALAYDKEFRINDYKKRNDDIIRYFKDRPDDLLVIDLSKEKDTGKIIKFLGLPEILIKTPAHLNKSK